MTDESSVISGTNITDHHIAMIWDDVIIETEVYIYVTSQVKWWQLDNNKAATF